MESYAELKAKIQYLEDKMRFIRSGGDVLRICKLEEENKKLEDENIRLKYLLKLAYDDVKAVSECYVNNGVNCSICDMDYCPITHKNEIEELLGEKL